jgi:hypothetical protein
MVRCHETLRHFRGWWRRDGVYVQTVAAEASIDEPQQMSA